MDIAILTDVFHKGGAKRVASGGVELKGVLRVTVQAGINLIDKDVTSKSDPFVKITHKHDYGHHEDVQTTRVIEDNLNPLFGETFPFRVCDPAPALSARSQSPGSPPCS